MIENLRYEEDTLLLTNGEYVRLIGVDTPETKHPEKPVEYFGKEAYLFTQTMVEGKEVRLEYDRPGDEKRPERELNRVEKMVEGKQKEIIGYFTDDRNIYCIECINKNREIMEKIEKAITADDTDEGELFCDECNKEIK